MCTRAVRSKRVPVNKGRLTVTPPEVQNQLAPKLTPRGDGPQDPETTIMVCRCRLLLAWLARRRWQLLCVTVKCGSWFMLALCTLAMKIILDMPVALRENTKTGFAPPPDWVFLT